RPMFSLWQFVANLRLTFPKENPNIIIWGININRFFYTTNISSTSRKRCTNKSRQKTRLNQLNFNLTEGKNTTHFYLFLDA
ncbi:MAG: hypothetical protein NTZ99_00995, partial [Burkholderiales bacterium]|nr:hypothetical protein [Burkholderiales bacterium]